MKLGPAAKYLATYAEPEIKIAAEMTERWKHAVVVPALGEAELFPGLWKSILMASPSPTLAIVVINAKDATRADAHEANEKLAGWLQRDLGAAKTDWGLRARVGLVDLLAVDRYSPGRRLLEKQGVGQARKIGCDLALAFFSNGQIECAGMDVTDADAELPPDYWSGDYLRPSFAGLRKSRPVVGLHAFTHRTVPGHERAIHEYETFLQYYVDGLAEAGSPYAFQTVGSTLRIGFEAYAEVRGFPDREAGEDFYLLNKLAKVGGVFHSGKTISLSGRPSWRVPFGTGQKVNQLSQLYREGGEYLVYDPRVFDALKKWNGLLEQWCVSAEDQPFWDGLGELSPLAEKLKAKDSLAAAKQSRKDARARSLHLREWFDAFRTLKFVHEVTDTLWPRIPINAALKNPAAFRTDISPARPDHP